jgi:hypothetical protein
MNSDADGQPSPDTLVWVRRHWNGTDGAQYRLGDVHRAHWSQTSGGEVDGFAKRSPRPMIHGYVNCDQAVDGELAHSCCHGPPPHHIKVCVVARDNGGSRSALMRHLKATADGNAGGADGRTHQRRGPRLCRHGSVG